MTTLFPRLPFVSDETPLSWAARLAAFHTGQRVVPFLRDQKIKLADVNHGRACAIDRLCAITGDDPGTVWHNTAISDGRLNFTLRGEPLPATMLLREETRFCPLCLVEDDALHANPLVGRRGRLAWSLRIVTTCPVHGLTLVPRKRDVWDDMAHELSVLVTETTDELRTLAARLSPRRPSDLQSYILGRLEGLKGPVWLDGLSLAQVVKTTEMLGVTMLHGPDVKLGQMTREHWEDAAREGWKWVSGGEAGVRDALSQLQQDAFDNGRGGLNYGSAFGKFYHWLAHRGARSDHETIRTVLRDYIIDNMDVAVGQTLLGKRIDRRQVYSVRSLSRIAHVQEVTLRNLLVASGHVPPSLADKPCSILVIDEGAARDLVATLEDTLGIAEAAVHLSANRQIVDDLLETGLLTPLHGGRGRKGRLSCRIPRGHADAVLDRLRDVAPVNANPPNGWTTLTSATKQARVTMRALLGLILTGQLTRMAMLRESGGFAAIRLDPQEIGSLQQSTA